jgi:hypothetical protein
MQHPPAKARHWTVQNKGRGRILSHQTLEAVSACREGKIGLIQQHMKTEEGPDDF